MNFNIGEQMSTETYRKLQRRIRGKFPEVDYAILEYLFFRNEYGAICEHIEMRTSIKHQTVSAQLRHLHKDGFVKYKMNNGKPVKAKTSSGSPAGVHILTNSGKAYYLKLAKAKEVKK